MLFSDNTFEISISHLGLEKQLNSNKKMGKGLRKREGVSHNESILLSLSGSVVLGTSPTSKVGGPFPTSHLGRLSGSGGKHRSGT